MNKNQIEDAWNLKWKNGKNELAALKLLENIDATIPNICITRARILSACRSAYIYNPEIDPGKIYRNKIKVEKKRLNQLAKAAHILAMSSERNDNALSWAMTYAEQNSGVRLTRQDKSEPQAHHLVANNYFKNLETALKGRLPEISGGPFMELFTIGNLLFNNAIAAGRPVTTATMLAFELAFYLRICTAGFAGDAMQNGMPMPTCGDPNYPVVTAFCLATLGASLDAKQTGDNVRKLKNVGLTRWPLVTNST